MTVETELTEDLKPQYSWMIYPDSMWAQGDANYFQLDHRPNTFELELLLLREVREMCSCLNKWEVNEFLAEDFTIILYADDEEVTRERRDGVDFVRLYVEEELAVLDAKIERLRADNPSILKCGELGMAWDPNPPVAHTGERRWHIFNGLTWSVSGQLPWTKWAEEAGFNVTASSDLTPAEAEVFLLEMVRLAVAGNPSVDQGMCDSGDDKEKLARQAYLLSDSQTLKVLDGDVEVFRVTRVGNELPDVAQQGIALLDEEIANLEEHYTALKGKK